MLIDESQLFNCSMGHYHRLSGFICRSKNQPPSYKENMAKRRMKRTAYKCSAWYLHRITSMAQQCMNLSISSSSPRWKCINTFAALSTHVSYLSDTYTIFPKRNATFLKLPFLGRSVGRWINLPSIIGIQFIDGVGENIVKLHIPI